MNNISKDIEKIASDFQVIKKMMAAESQTATKEFGITLTQGAVLFLIMHKNGKSLTELAECLGISKSAATQLVNGLVEKELLIREYNNKDRRLSQIYLSENSKEHLKKLRKKMIEKISKLFKVLNDEEICQLSAITNKLAKQKEENE